MFYFEKFYIFNFFKAKEALCFRMAFKIKNVNLEEKKKKKNHKQQNNNSKNCQEIKIVYIKLL